jgi:hypothetical protein
LSEAKKANSIAEEANHFSGDANTIAERALRVAQDDVPYNWSLDVGDDGVAVVLNDCGHRALQTTVVLDSDGQILGETEPVDVEPFGEITLDVTSTIEQHFDAVRRIPWCAPIVTAACFSAAETAYRWPSNSGHT